MNYRMDKYDVNNDNIPKRTERNRNLYESEAIDNYDKFDVNSIPEENIRINSNYDYLLLYIYQYSSNDFFIDIKIHY